MFTHHVRLKLAADYGIRDIPNELLVDMVRQARYSGADIATVAFIVASAWQTPVEINQ